MLLKIALCIYGTVVASIFSYMIEEKWGYNDE